MDVKGGPSAFQCACDGGARPKSIDPFDPFGYHFVGCKTKTKRAADAIRLHDD